MNALTVMQLKNKNFQIWLKWKKPKAIHNNVILSLKKPQNCVHYDTLLIKLKATKMKQHTFRNTYVLKPSVK